MMTSPFDDIGFRIEQRLDGDWVKVADVDAREQALVERVAVLEADKSLIQQLLTDIQAREQALRAEFLGLEQELQDEVARITKIRIDDGALHTVPTLTVWMWLNKFHAVLGQG